MASSVQAIVANDKFVNMFPAESWTPQPSQ